MTKIKRIAVLMTSALMMTSQSWGQSSVTLYGVIDTGVDFVNNSAGSQIYAMKDGTYTGIYGSRWGLLGKEDLGGGWATIFRLENGFNIPDGTLAQGGLLFGRQAYVGLTSTRYGTVTLGRQYDSVADFMQFSSTTSEFGTYAGHATDIDNISDSFRINNSIKYLSPTMGGARFGGLMELSGATTPDGAHRIAVWSVGADYTFGSAKIAAAYLYANKPAQIFTGANGHFTSNTTGEAIGAAGPWSYVGQPDHMSILAAGGTYSFGNATIGGMYSKARFSQANGTSGDVSYDDYDLSLRYQITPPLRLIAGYLYTVGHIDYLGQTLKYHRVIAGARYFLSKRTELYGLVAFQQAAGDAKYADLYYGVAALMSTTNRQVGTRVGIIHRF